MVDVFIASLYRQGHIVKTVESLWKNPQVSTITVVLNNYTNEQYREVFAGLKGCTIIRGNNRKRDSEKLRYFNLSKNPYIATCDDDLIYPPDYFERLLAGAEKHKAIVSFHGWNLRKRITDYYKARSERFICIHEVKEDVEADVIGTGVCLFEKAILPDFEKTYDHFPYGGAADIHLSHFAKTKGVKRVVLAHEKDWIVMKPAHKDDKQIYGERDTFRKEFLTRKW